MNDATELIKWKTKTNDFKTYLCTKTQTMFEIKLQVGDGTNGYGEFSEWSTINQMLGR